MGGREFSVLTFNVFDELPACQFTSQRLQLIASGLAAEQPDLICLQELVKAKVCGDTGEALCDLLNLREEVSYNLRYARADATGEADWAVEFGLGLMTKAPSDFVEVLRYSSQVELKSTIGGQHYRLPDDRVAMHARLNLGPTQHLDAYVTHLTSLAESEGGSNIRLTQAHELIEWIAKTRNADNPVIVAGDLNDVPDSQTVSTLLQFGLYDAWAEQGSGPGYTSGSAEFDLQSPNRAADERIDYIFFQPGKREEVRVLDTKLLFDRVGRKTGREYLWPSDHFGVLAKFQFD